MKDINKMTRQDFEKVQYREHWNGNIECDCLVILPSQKYTNKELHDSGYRKMDFVLIKNGKLLCRASGRSDVLHIGGIGGYGLEGFTKEYIKSTAWSIDCLAKSGLLRLFTNHTLIVGSSLSSFEVWESEKEK